MAGIAIDNRVIAILDDCHNAIDAANEGQTERPGYDNGVRGRAFVFQNNRAQTRVSIFQKICRSEASGDKNFAIEIRAGHAAFMACKQTQQAVVEVFKVVKPVAQIAVRCAFKAGAGLTAALLLTTLKPQLRRGMQMAKECGFLAEARSKDESFLGLLIDAR